MNQSYKVYYNIESRSKFRSIHDSDDVVNLDEVKALLKELVSEDDSISIYLNTDNLRAQIWGLKDKEKCVLELHDARKGVCFSRESNKNDLELEVEADLDKYIKDPVKYGFDAESF